MKIELDYIVPEPSRTAPNLIADLDVSANYIVDLYNQSNINRQYNDFLKGKSVVIVGPASYLEGRGLGEFFDSFDVVVRLNRSFPVTNTNDYGTRCDIRYHNMSQNNAQGGPLDIDLMLSLGVKYVSSPFPKHMDYFHNDIVECERQLSGSGIEFHHWSDLEQFLTFHMLLNTRPNIGTCAILDLLNYDIKSLHVSGITFFKDGYNSQYSDRDDDLVPAYHANGVANHAQKPQKQLIKLIGEFDSRITFDDEVKDSL
jgi:hypothetical protein